MIICHEKTQSLLIFSHHPLWIHYHRVYQMCTQSTMSFFHQRGILTSTALPAPFSFFVDSGLETLMNRFFRGWLPSSPPIAPTKKTNTPQGYASMPPRPQNNACVTRPPTNLPKDLEVLNVHPPHPRAQTLNSGGCCRRRKTYQPTPLQFTLTKRCRGFWFPKCRATNISRNQISGIETDLLTTVPMSLWGVCVPVLQIPSKDQSSFHFPCHDGFARTSPFSLDIARRRRSL